MHWEWQAANGVMGKSRFGGGKTGPNTTDRAKTGTKKSVLVEQHGGPLSTVIDGANVSSGFGLQIGPQWQIVQCRTNLKSVHLQVFLNRGDWIRTSDRPAPSRVRYQTAPLPVATAWSLARGRLQAGDGNRTRPRSLEGFCATTTLRPQALADDTGLDRARGRPRRAPPTRHSRRLGLLSPGARLAAIPRRHPPPAAPLSAPRPRRL